MRIRSARRRVSTAIFVREARVSERPDPRASGGVYIALVACAALSMVLTWPRAMEQPETERVGYLIGMGFAALGLPLLSGWLSRKLGMRPGPVIVSVALLFLVTRVVENVPGSEVMRARAELAQSLEAAAEHRAAGDRVGGTDRVVAATEKAMIAEGKMSPQGAGVFTRLVKDLQGRVIGHSGRVNALVDAGGCKSRGLDSLAALDARKALITDARTSAETTGAFLRGFMADAERDLRAAGVDEAEIAGFRRGQEAGGRYATLIALCDAHVRQFQACEAQFQVLRDQFGRWSHGSGQVLFAAEAPDEALAIFNSASATINAETVTLDDLQQKLAAASATN